MVTPPEENVNKSPPYVPETNNKEEFKTLDQINSEKSSPNDKGGLLRKSTKRKSMASSTSQKEETKGSNRNSTKKANQNSFIQKNIDAINKIDRRPST